MTDTTDLEKLRCLAVKLRLYGLLSDWPSLANESWVSRLIHLELTERARRSKQYRIRNAMIGEFKSLVDFDWKHPKRIDRMQIQELMTLDFVGERSNVVILGPNGVGKTMIAKNIAYASVVRGWSTRFCAASELLNDLSSFDGSALRQRLKRYVAPNVLLVDELGYLRYDNRHADLLYEVVRQRYDRGASIVFTTNKAFSEWNQVFESAGCLVTLIDRVCHRAEIVEIDGASYRALEAKKHSTAKRANRKSQQPSPTTVDS